MSTLISIRTDKENIAALDQIAELLDRNRNWVINEAIQNYLELHEWQLEHIKKGRADAEAGRTLSLEEVRARIRKRHDAAKAASLK